MQFSRKLFDHRSRGLPNFQILRTRLDRLFKIGIRDSDLHLHQLAKLPEQYSVLTRSFPQALDQLSLIVKYGWKAKGNDGCRFENLAEHPMEFERRRLQLWTQPAGFISVARCKYCQRPEFNTQDRIAGYSGQRASGYVTLRDAIQEDCHRSATQLR